MGLADVDIGDTPRGDRRCKVGKLIDHYADWGLDETDRDWLTAQLEIDDRGLNRDSSVLSYADLARMLTTYTGQHGTRWTISLSALRSHARRYCACHL